MENLDRESSLYEGYSDEDSVDTATIMDENLNSLCLDEGTASDAVMTTMSIWKLRFVNQNITSSANVREMINKYNCGQVEEEVYIRDDGKIENVEVYKQTKFTKTRLELIHGTETFKRKTINCISVFYTYDGNVYAQTSGTAWHVVCNYGDTDFPDRISRRLLDCKGMKSQSRRPISGNTVYQQKRCKNPERSNLTERQNVRVCFTADLRENASIRDIDCFSKPNKKIMVKVGSACVCLEGIKRGGIKNVINHFNDIYNGQRTRTTDGFEEKDTDAFTESLKAAGKEETKDLDATLKEHMKNYILGKQDFMEHLNDFELCQDRSVAPILYAHNFKIDFNRKIFHFDQLPTLEVVLNKIKEINLSSLTLMNKEININISYECNNRKHRMRLFRLIEGTMMKKDQMYYRIESKWYYMDEDYIRAIHIGFRGFLRDRLITDGPIILESDWIDCDEGDYNSVYMRFPNFLVGDNCTYGNIELFDLLKYEPQSGHVYLYHVKKGLEGNTRTLVCQAMSAVDVIDKCLSTNQHLELFHYYERITKLYANKGYPMPAFCDTFEKFRNLLSKKNHLTTVCALFVPGMKKGRLTKEKDATDFFGTVDILREMNYLPLYEQNALTKHFYSHTFKTVSHHIFESLITNKYVKASNDRADYGSSTSKLLLAHRYEDRYRTERTERDSNYFSICQGDNIDRIVWKLIEPFSSDFKSTTAKHSLMKMNETGIDFKICEIPGYLSKKNYNKSNNVLNDRNRNNWNYENGYQNRNCSNFVNEYGNRNF